MPRNVPSSFPFPADQSFKSLLTLLPTPTPPTASTVVYLSNVDAVVAQMMQESVALLARHAGTTAADYRARLLAEKFTAFCQALKEAFAVPSYRSGLRNATGTPRTDHPSKRLRIASTTSVSTSSVCRAVLNVRAASKAPAEIDATATAAAEALPNTGLSDCDMAGDATADSAFTASDASAADGNVDGHVLKKPLATTTLMRRVGQRSCAELFNR